MKAANGEEVSDVADHDLVPWTILLNTGEALQGASLLFWGEKAFCR